MSLPAQLVDHARGLISQADDRLEEVNLRRAVSASYYALFHQLNADAAALVAPNVSAETNHRIQRWFEHREMRKVCSRFTSVKLDQPLLGLLGPSASADMQTVARAFIQLQDARHAADYDLGAQLTTREAIGVVDLAVQALSAWQRLQGTAEANIFILSLLLWKNWDRDRL